MYEIPSLTYYYDYGYANAAFTRILNEGNYFCLSKIDIEFADGTTANLTDEDLLGGRVKVRSSIGNNNSFGFGCICAKTVEFTVKNTTTLGAKDWRNAKLTVQCGIHKRINEFADTPSMTPVWVEYEEFVPMGVFFVDEIEKPQETISVKGMDGIQFLNKSIVNSDVINTTNTYISSADFIAELVAITKTKTNQYGIRYRNMLTGYKYDSSWSNCRPPLDQSLTYREYLEQVLTLQGRILFIDEENYLKLGEMNLPITTNNTIPQTAPGIALTIKPDNRYSYTPDYKRYINAFAMKTKASTVVLGNYQYSLWNHDPDSRDILMLPQTDIVNSDYAVSDVNNIIQRLPKDSNGTRWDGCILPYECEYIGDPRVELLDLIRFYPDGGTYSDYDDALGYGYVFGIDFTNGESQYLYSGDINDNLHSENELIPSIKSVIERPLPNTDYATINNVLKSYNLSGSNSISYGNFIANLSNIKYNKSTRIFQFQVNVIYTASTPNKSCKWIVYLNVDAMKKTVNGSDFTLEIDGEDNANIGQLLILCDSTYDYSLQCWSSTGLTPSIEHMEYCKIEYISGWLYVRLRYNTSSSTSFSGLFDGRQMTLTQ